MENQLNDQFMKLQHQMRRYMHQQMAKNKGFEPHRGQGRVLALLKLHPEISQKDLTFVLGMRPQSLGELLQKMADKEWITREPSTEDKRVMIVKITDLGKAEAEKINQRPDFTSELFENFSAEEKEQWSQLIEKLIVNLQEKLGTEEEPEFFGGPGFGGPHHHGHHHEGHGHHGPHHGHHHHHDGCSRDSHETADENNQ